jgi:hypothetical protein
MDDETIALYTRAGNPPVFARPRPPAYIANTESRIIVVRTEPVAIFVTDEG